MGWLDKVPRAGNIYIGGIYSLRRTDALKEANLTHVLSVVRFDLNEEQLRNFKHLQIEIDDEDDEDLLQYFPVTNRFIKDALDGGGSVLVHCAMGKSRSAATVMAYLMHEYHVTPTEALQQIREGRGVCDPNPGFKRQLELYHSMLAPADVENAPAYQRWLYQRELDASRRLRQAPDADKIRFEDEHEGGGTAGADAAERKAEVELRCRKCRRQLATSAYIIPHKPKQTPSQGNAGQAGCAHHFLDALSWMRPELEQGKVEGRLECPNAKCTTNVGKYAWHGMRCSCGEWVVPGISLAKGKVDEAPMRSAAGGDAGAGGGGAAGAGIRLPPNMKAGSNL